MIKINPQVEIWCEEKDFYYFLKFPANKDQSFGTLFRCHQKYKDNFISYRRDGRELVDITDFIMCDFQTINMFFPSIEEEKMWTNILKSYDKLVKGRTEDMDYDYVSPL